MYNELMNVKNYLELMGFEVKECIDSKNSIQFKIDNYAIAIEFDYESRNYNIQKRNRYDKSIIFIRVEESNINIFLVSMIIGYIRKAVGMNKYVDPSTILGTY